MMTLIRKVRLATPDGLIAGELLVQDGKIADFGVSLGNPDGADIIAAEGAILCPGLVDMRASLGEPGYEYRETIASAAQAAAAGGITSIAVLPDTKPAIDDPALVRFIRARGEEIGMVSLIPYAAATRGCKGEELAEYGLLKAEGAVAFTDGRKAVASIRLMRNALSYASGFGARIVQHPEDPELAAGGAATSGARATIMGLPGIPAAAEAIMVARDIRLAEMTGGAVHFAHITTAEACALIRQAKDKGLHITCDTAPPYFDLNETAIGDFR
ncbi:MAG: amidohydrolase family protein, partial [Acidocella sp.]|nr:amidohydrolase family protein [Acidocella sp.]